jgi:hypothetical protein
MVATNTQQTFIHAIPAQLLTMFQHRVYVPLSFFLIKSMERIRLERDIKSFKSLTKPIRVIDASNFIDERKLTFTQFNQAYHNFLQCLELCCEPGSGILEGWKDHFERTVRDPNMEEKFKIYLYMDILMRQQLMVQPFIPDVLSKEYNECYAMAHRDINDEHTAELVETKIAASRSSYSSNRDHRYQPYNPTSSTNPSGFRSALGTGSGGGNYSFRNKDNQFSSTRLCLRCGSKDSHISTNCDAKHIHNHPDRKTNVSVRDRRLVFNTDGAAVCFKFNLQGSCNADPTRHPPHRCSICLVSYHGAAQCPRI